MQLNTAINAIDRILIYLEPLLPFANSHMVDIFTNNLYEKYIPLSIRQELNSLNSNEALNAFWSVNIECTELNKYRNESHNHTLYKIPEICLNLNEFEQKLSTMCSSDLSRFQMNSFMSFKKSHEVEMLSKITSAINKISNTSHIIDIGDGKGYLSSALTIHSKMKVLGIDASPINTNGAAKRVAKLNKVLKRTENKVFNSELYKQTTKYITKDTNLNEIVKESFSDNEINNLGLVGLHTCGNLASSSLRIYHGNDNIKNICNVGCCYHLMTEENNINTTGFPMSNYLQNKNCFLGRNARMIAAQSLERMIHEKEPPSDILFYRSLLQIILIEYSPELLSCHVGRFKKSATFTQYVRKSLSKLNCKNIPTDDVILKLYEEYLPRLKELQVYYMLRAHLAPVIEAVILLDRLIYLYELGYNNSYLVQFFDPVISPRCYGIVSFK